MNININLENLKTIEEIAEEIKQNERKVKELQKEIDAGKELIKEYMTEYKADKVTAGIYKISYYEVQRETINKAKLKEYADIYNEVSSITTYKALKIS